ncbi:MAG: hypothetical protein DRI26_04950 [Chloroflexi bacterium]|nr:MAG: hypothetical protein DRI26_04950 [Chloroflexota bacterium]
MAKHKLLIEFELEFHGPLSSFLKAAEVIRGEPFKLNLYATNLGSSEFPGANVIDLRIEYRPYGLRGSFSTPATLPSCPPLKPAKKVKFYSDEFVPVDEGTAWIHLKMEAKDKGEIEYYQVTEKPLPGSEWVNHFYVVSREEIRILALLSQLLNKIK